MNAELHSQTSLTCDRAAAWTSGTGILPFDQDVNRNSREDEEESEKDGIGPRAIDRPERIKKAEAAENADLH